MKKHQNQKSETCESKFGLSQGASAQQNRPCTFFAKKVAEIFGGLRIFSYLCSVNNKDNSDEKHIAGRATRCSWPTRF